MTHCLPIDTLHGVGKRAAAVRKMGISSPYDLLYHIPRTYLDYRNTVAVAMAPDGEVSVLRGTIVKRLGEQRIRRGLSLFRAVATDGETDFTVTIFNNFYGYDQLHEGEDYYFSGKVTHMGHRHEIASRDLRDAVCCTVYALTTGCRRDDPENIARSGILEKEPLMLRRSCERRRALHAAGGPNIPCPSARALDAQSGDGV